MDIRAKGTKIEARAGASRALTRVYGIGGGMYDDLIKERQCRRWCVQGYQHCQPILGLEDERVEFRGTCDMHDDRVSRFEEAFTIIRTLLRDGEIDFDGAYYQARGCELRPRGPRPAGPPMLIGSVSPRMLSLAARHADQWNGWIPDRSRVEEVAPLRRMVDEACEEVGRNPATLERTVTIRVNPMEQRGSADPGILTGAPEVLAEALRAFAREGISHIQISFETMTLACIEALAPTLQLLARI